MAEATGEPDLLAPLLPGGEPLEKLLRKAQFAPWASRAPIATRHHPGGREAKEFWHRAMATRQGRPVHACADCSSVNLT